MRHLTLTAIGEDRPGIVAAVTEVLYDLGCNLSDCSMVLLRGQFAMILLVEAPDEVTADRLTEAMSTATDALGLSATVREVVSLEEVSAARPYVVSLYGADRPGIVYRVSKALAQRGINITNLQSHLTDGIYTMVLEIDLPGRVDPEELDTEIRSIASELHVDYTLRPSEADEL